MKVSKQQFQIDQDAQRFLRDRAPNYSPPITSRLVRLIRRRLSEGVAQGERLSAMAARVQRVLGGSEGVVRAARIVRTEVVSAFNAGSVQNYIANSDVVEQKEWLTARDANVRPTQAGDFDHQTADTQRVPVRDPFIVSGERLMHPGDPAASPGNTINCRCTVTPVTSRTPPAGRVPPTAAFPTGVAVVGPPRGPRRTTRPRRRTVRPERGPACKVCGDIHDTIKKARRCPVKPKPRADRPGRRKQPRRGGPSAATQPAGALPGRAMDAEPRSVPKDAKVGQFHSPDGKKVKPGEQFRGQPSAVIRPNKNGMIMWTPTRSAAEFHRDGAIRAGKDGRLVSANLKFKNALRVSPEFFDELSVASKSVIADLKRQGFDAILTDVEGSIGVAVFNIKQLENVSIRFDGKRRARQLLPGGRRPRRRKPRLRKPKRRQALPRPDTATTRPRAASPKARTGKAPKVLSNREVNTEFMTKAQNFLGQPDPTATPLMRTALKDKDFRRWVMVDQVVADLNGISVENIGDALGFYSPITNSIELDISLRRLGKKKVARVMTHEMFHGVGTNRGWFSRKGGSVINLRNPEAARLNKLYRNAVKRTEATLQSQAADAGLSAKTRRESSKWLKAMKKNGKRKSFGKGYDDGVQFFDEMENAGVIDVEKAGIPDPYALHSAQEYSTTSFEAFVFEPETLRRRDPDMFNFFSNFYSDGVFKQLIDDMLATIARGTEWHS